ADARQEPWPWLRADSAGEGGQRVRRSRARPAGARASREDAVLQDEIQEIVGRRHGMAASVKKSIRLSPERAEYLARLAQAHHVSEEQIIDKALDMLFSLTDFLEAQTVEPTQMEAEEEFRRQLRETGLLAPTQTPPSTESVRDRTPIQVTGLP